MKLLKILLISFFVSGSAYAEIKDVDITWFREAGNRQVTTVAEVCGKVEFQNEKLVQVVLTVDKGRAAATYTTMTDSNGKFCQIVSTLYGRVSAEAFGVLSGSKSPTKEFKLK